MQSKQSWKWCSNHVLGYKVRACSHFMLLAWPPMHIFGFTLCVTLHRAHCTVLCTGNKEREYESVIRGALEPLIQRGQFPRTSIMVVLQVGRAQPLLPNFELLS